MLVSNLDRSLQAATGFAIAEVFGDTAEPQIQPTNPEFEGSHTVVCFPLTKISKRKPEETAQAIGEHLLKHSRLVSKFNVVKGFLNLSLTDETWVKVFESIVMEENYGV